MDIPHDFRISRFEYMNTRITVEDRGDGKWAVCDAGLCLNHAGEWEREPLPSSRTDEFKARCRFDGAEQAFSACRKAWLAQSGLPT